MSPILRASQNPIWRQEWRRGKRREAAGEKHLSPKGPYVQLPSRVAWHFQADSFWQYTSIQLGVQLKEAGKTGQLGRNMMHLFSKQTFVLVIEYYLGRY